MVVVGEWLTSIDGIMERNLKAIFGNLIPRRLWASIAFPDHIINPSEQ